MYKDPTNFRKRFQAYKNGKMPYKDGRPVKFEDGTEPKYRYLRTENGWVRVPDQGDTQRAFEDLTVTPQGVKYKRVPRKIDNSEQAVKERERYASTHSVFGTPKDGLEIVSPEFDLLTLGAGFRFNPLSQTLRNERTVAKAIDREVKAGLKGATKDMPVVRQEDLYNPDHFKTVAPYNKRQIAANVGEQSSNVSTSQRSAILDAIEDDPTLTDGLYVYPMNSGKNRVDLINGTLGNRKDITKPFIRPLERKTVSHVDEDGNIDMRGLVRDIKGFYKTHPHAVPYKMIYNSSGNLYEHIRDVVKTAQQIPVPTGYTRKQLVEAALYHDIGKVFDRGRSSHGPIAVDMLRGNQINLDPQVENAIANHMSRSILDKDELTKALHFADVARGMSWDDASFKLRHLSYDWDKPTINIPKKPLREELKTHINPWLKNKGYETIPLNVSEEEAWAALEDRIDQHLSFLRGVRDPIKDTDTSPNAIRNKENSIQGIMNQYGLGFNYASSPEAAPYRLRYGATTVPTSPTGRSRRSNLYSDHNDNMGLTQYDRTHYSDMIGSNPDTRDALYVSTSDQVADQYATANTDSRSGGAFIVQLPKNERVPGESMSEHLLKNDFEMIDTKTLDGQRRGVGAIYEDPYRLQTGRSLQKDMIDAGVIKPQYIDNPNGILYPEDFSSRYNDILSRMDKANSILSENGINFRFNTTSNGGIVAPRQIDAVTQTIDNINATINALRKRDMWIPRDFHARVQKLPSLMPFEDLDAQDAFFDSVDKGFVSPMPDELLEKIAESPESTDATAIPGKLGLWNGVQNTRPANYKEFRNMAEWPGLDIADLVTTGNITKKQKAAIYKAFKYGSEDPVKYMPIKKILNNAIDSYIQSVKGKKFHRKIVDPKSLKIKPEDAAKFMRERGIRPRYEVEGYGKNNVYVIDANTKNRTKNARDIKRTYGYVLGQKGEKRLNIREQVDFTERKNPNHINKDSGSYSKRKISRKTLRNILPPIFGAVAYESQDK